MLSNLDLSNKEYLKENFSRFIISKVLYLSNKRCFQHLQSDTPKVSHTGKKPDVSKTIKKKKSLHPPSALELLLSDSVSSCTVHKITKY